MDTAHSHHTHPPDAPCDTTGRHGMLVFGTDEQYMSHLPMFDCPHNYELQMQVEFDSSTLAALRADQAAGTADMYTFDPVPFPITELNPDNGGPIRDSIQGALVRGHFERGGTPIARHATATIRQVGYFRELDLDAKPAEDQPLRYLCFGQPGRLYLAHQIFAAPSFDQVLAVRLVPGTVTDQAGRSQDDDVSQLGFPLATPVRFDRADHPGSRLTAGLTAPGLFEQQVSVAGMHGFRVQVHVEQELYLEINELS